MASAEVEESYHWSLDEAEYAIDIGFYRQADLQAIYGHLIRTAIHTVKPDELPKIVRHLKGILGRFLDSLYCLEACFVADSTLEDLPSPSHVGKARVGGLDLNKPRTRLVMESVLSLSTAPCGFTTSQLASRAKEIGGPSDYTSRQAAYDIRKLRAKRLVKKLKKSRRYQPTPDGLRAMAALVVLRDKVIKPLLAANLQTKRGRKPKNHTAIDQHYDRIRSEMQELFQALGIAA